MNYRKLAAPNGDEWSVDAVLRALWTPQQIGAGDIYMSSNEYMLPNEARGPSYHDDSDAMYAATMASTRANQFAEVAQDA